MSSEMQKFYGMALKNPALVNDLIAITDPEAYAKKTVELGAANGCNFTEAEVAVWAKEKAAAFANNELDDQELEAVAGGRWSFMKAMEVVFGTEATVAGYAALGMGAGISGAILIGGGGALADHGYKRKK